MQELRVRYLLKSKIIGELKKSAAPKDPHNPVDQHLGHRVFSTVLALRPIWVCSDETPPGRGVMRELFDCVQRTDKCSHSYQ